MRENVFVYNFWPDRLVTMVWRRRDPIRVFEVQRRLYLPDTLTLTMTRLSNLDPRIAGISLSFDKVG